MQTINHYRTNSDKKLVLDWRRSGTMFTIGLVIGPGIHYWYRFLDKILPTTQIKSVGSKVLLDQLGASPVLYYAFFISGGMLDGHSYTDSWQEFKDKFLMVYKVDWAFWPAAQFMNFYYVPARLRVMYVSVATLFWNVFLSYVRYDMDADEDTRRECDADG